MRALTFFSLIALLLTSALTTWAEPHTLIYQKENKWVGKEDKAALRALLKEAKQEKARHFYITLPEEKRALSIERLKVLRNILATSLKSGVILEEKEGQIKANTLQIWPASTKK